MKRRQFLERASLFSLGSLLLPASLLSSCRKEDLFKDFKYDGKVIVIGAGVAGLYAGYLLKSKGVDFQILEASNTYGGRMGRTTGFADYTIDNGAQWLHGKNNILGDLINQTKTKIVRDDSELTYWFNNELVSDLPKDPFIFEEDNMPDLSFKDYAHQEGFGNEYDNIIEAIAGDQGASASTLSAYWNSKDEENWVSGDEDFKFEESYFDFIDREIALPILDHLLLNTIVKNVDYSGEEIVIQDSLGQEYRADKIIVTVPISILKLNEINFVPSFSSAKTEAFSKFGMGPGMKVFLKFSTKFYNDFIYGGSICGAYADDTVGKNTNDHVVLAFVMGDQAAALSALGSDAAIAAALVAELDTMYAGQASANFLDALVFDYTNKAFIKGAYGYSTIGMGDARKLAAEPINQKVYFAGEAMNVNGHHQTVFGAVEASYKAILDLYKDAKK